MRSGKFGPVIWTIPLLLATPGLAGAQPAQAPTAAEAQAALNPAPQPEAFSRAQLDQMLAPIALYPDQLLLQVLMAATFPQQVVDAGKWLGDSHNAALSGDALVAALQPLPWDPSVKSLVAFPQIITMMSDHLDWTEALGTAFANQQVAAMARVQFLRERAAASGQLKSTAHLRIERRERDIIIEPAKPDRIYVPIYNPAVVYGAWPDRDAPPVYIPPPHRYYEGAIGAGIAFAAGAAIVAPLWNWGHPDWRRHEVIVDRQRYDRITNERDARDRRTEIRNDIWHRTGPVAQVPETERPHRAPENGPRPPGTVSPGTIVPPKPAHGPEPHPGPGPTPHPGPEPHPGPGPTPHPGPEPHPGPGPTRHPGPEPHPGPGPTPHPGPEPHPGPGPTPHPGPEPHPGPGPTPHPGPEPHPGPGPTPHPGPVPHPGPAPETHRLPTPVPHPGPAPETHTLPTPMPHPGPAPETHRLPTPAPHPGPAPETHTLPTPMPHPGPAPETHRLPTPAPHRGPAPETHPGPAKKPPPNAGENEQH